MGVGMKPDPDLVWYFCDSASELGMHAAAIGGDANCGSNVPEQNWPSKKMCKAAGRWRKIRDALFQLSATLQCVLECAYEAQGLSVQDRFEYDLSAPLVIKARARMKGASADDKKKLEALISNADMLLGAAHTAFRIAHGPAEPRGRPARRRFRVEKWLTEEGLRV